MRVIPVLLLAGLSLPALAIEWSVDHDNSRLGFVGTQGGAEFQGTFHDWQARMVFDPDNLADSGFQVDIDVTSVDTESADRDSIIGDPEWFGVEEFPGARFETHAFESLGDDRYQAQGTLTIRAVSQEINLPFSWVVTDDTAKMIGEVTLDRTTYNVGTGEWSSEEMVAHPVKVVVELNLQQLSQ